MAEDPQTRQRLPNRQHSVVLDFDYRGNRYELCAGMFVDGRVGEVFIGGAKVGSDSARLLSDLGVLISSLFRNRGR